MNIAHFKISAASGDHFCGYSLVRRLAACCLVGAAAMSAAHAGPGDRDRDAQRVAQRDAMRSERMSPPQRQSDERQQREFDSRAFEERAEEQRRNLQMQQEQNAQNADAFRRSGRLTPDERRDLRRQINEAGADIYPNRRRR